MGYLKRHVMPRFWPVHRKVDIWGVKPRAGPHKIEACIPLQLVVKDMAKLASNSVEARKIIKSESVLVDRKPRKDTKYPVGLMDLIEVPKLNKFYQLVPRKNVFNVFELREIKKEDSEKKLCKIRHKKTVKGGLFQLGLHDGRNIMTDKNEYKPGDSLLLKLPDQEILEHHKLEVGSNAIVFDGKNVGTEGVIKDIINGKTLSEVSRIVLDSDGNKIETLKDYVLVTGKQTKVSAPKEDAKEKKGK